MKKYLLLTALAAFIIEFVLHTATDFIPRNSPAALFVVVVVVMGALLPVALAAAAYYQLRARRAGKKSETIAVAGTTIGLVAASLVSVLTVDPWIAHETPTSAAGIASATILNLVVTFMLCLIGSALANRLYRRGRSIITG